MKTGINPCVAIYNKVMLNLERLECHCFIISLFAFYYFSQILIDVFLLQSWFNSCLFWNFYQYILGNIDNFSISAVPMLCSSLTGVLQGFELISATSCLVREKEERSFSTASHIVLRKPQGIVPAVNHCYILDM